MSLQRILISACLLGNPVRYNGTARPLDDPRLQSWRDEGRLVTICPEVTAGFAIPRPAAEITDGASGEAVLDGEAKVLERTGADVTALFLAGAQAALALALGHDCRFALLTEGSPSCGSGFIHDGSFSGGRHAGHGVTAALLLRNGIRVFSEGQIAELAACLEPASAQLRLR